MRLDQQMWQALRWWHWMFVPVIVAFWSYGTSWGTMSGHFGFDMMLFMAIMTLVFIAPFFAIYDVGAASLAYRKGSLTFGGLWLRRAWSAVLIGNWCVVAWQLLTLRD